MCQRQPTYVKAYEGLLHNWENEKPHGSWSLVLLWPLTPMRITHVRIPTSSMAVPTGLALNRLKPKEPDCLLSQLGTNPELQQLQWKLYQAEPGLFDLRWDLSRRGEAVQEFSALGKYPERLSQSSFYRTSQIPKFPGRWVDQSKHPLKTELGNRLLTLRVTWREMLRHKGLKMRGREWM